MVTEGPLPNTIAAAVVRRLTCDTSAMAGTHVLTDGGLDAALRRDGFVVMPFLRPEVVAELREEFGRLRGWEGSGFHSDLVVDDVDYRRQVSSAIGAVVDGPGSRLFVDHEPFLRNFLCKYPGDDSSLYLHRDWMYVDERAGERTYVVWVALEDIVGHNGQLRVLRGSHEIDPSLRGTDLVAPWLSFTDVIEPRLLSVPVRAGEAIVFDNALVHCSYPNLTDVPRVAAAVAFRRRGTPLVHFARTGDGRAARYDVDEEFFLDRTPQQLMAEGPSLPVAENLDAPQLALDPTTLARMLDRGWRARVDRVHGSVTRGAASVRAAATGVRDGVTSRVDGLRRVAPAARSKLPDAAKVAEWWRNAPSVAAMAVLRANEAYINRFGPATPVVWDHHQFEWSHRVEAAWPEILDEVRGLLAGPTDIPHIEDVTGGIPQGNIGPWRSFVMMHQGHWIDWNCERCPRTAELVRSIPGLTVAGFSVLEPGTHITTHRGPNKGALRYQLGVIVPGAEGDCRIRVGDEMLIWRDGEGVMFDFTIPHEAWNDSDGIRVLLMLELLTPMPWYIDLPNRLAQRAMGWFPTTRDLRNRLHQLEPTLRRAG